MDLFRCRVCLENGGELNYVFSHTDDFEIDYATMIMLCAAVQIDGDDAFPKGICMSCALNLKQAYRFKTLCEQSHEKLNMEETNIDLIPEDIETVEHEDVEENDCDDTMVATEVDCDTEEIKEEYDADMFISDYDKTGVESKILKQYKCEFCHLVFKRIDYFKKHLNTHGVSPDQIPTYITYKTFTCELCDKEFQSSHGLRYHIEHHKGIKNYKCPQENCNWSFISKQGLSNHIRRHDECNSFLCNLCGKTFKSKDSLSHHLKYHTGKKPFKCMSCDKEYYQVCHLKKHMLVHKGTKPYTCESCGRSYTTNSQLKKHYNKFCGLGLKPVFKFKKSEKVLKKC